MLCGPVTADAFQGLVREIQVRGAYLDCPDEFLVSRLRARGETEAAIADELTYAAALRGSSYTPIPVEDLPLSTVAEKVVQWLRSD